MDESQSSALGLKVFGPLRAEDEPWLAECFVPPTEFDLMGEMNSIVVFGPPGSGKSAVRRMLTARMLKPDGTPSCLIVEWQPNPAVWDPAVGFQSVPGQTAHIFDLAAAALLRYLALHPQGWAGAPEWTRQMLAWFVRQFLRGEATMRAADLLEGMPGSEVVAQLIQGERGESLLPPNDWRLVIAEFSKSIQKLGLQGAWVVVDGVEIWLSSRTEAEPFLTSFWNFMSTLSLFEQGNFAYKVFLPSSLYPQLATAAGVDRNRLSPLWLSWSESRLWQIARRRVALALGRPDCTIEMLCTAPRFLETVRRTGGENPRAWLEILRPVVAHYLESGRPATEAEWKQLRRQVPHRLYLDEDAEIIVVNGRTIPREKLSPGAYRILRYLYHNAGRVIPLIELYKKGYLEQADSQGKKSGYEEVLYSRLSEIRTTIEPDPRDPVYLRAIREKGVQLRLTW